MSVRGTNRTCRDVRFKSVMRSIVLQKSFCRRCEISGGDWRVIRVRILRDLIALRQIRGRLR